MPDPKKPGSNDAADRRRGRPSGKNRVPLSLEEKRARNAQYERERRVETAAAMAQLAEAVNCDPNTSNADLLATAITHIQKYTQLADENGTDNLRRINQKLKSQIQMLKQRLQLLSDNNHKASNEESNTSSQPSTSKSTKSNKKPSKKQKTNHKRRSTAKQELQDKRSKTRSETSGDSGIDMQSTSPALDCEEIIMEILKRSLLITAIKGPGDFDAPIEPVPPLTANIGATVATCSQARCNYDVLNSVNKCFDTTTYTLPTIETSDLLTDNERIIVLRWLKEEYKE